MCKEEELSTIVAIDQDSRSARWSLRPLSKHSWEPIRAQHLSILQCRRSSVSHGQHMTLLGADGHANPLV